MFEVLLIGVLVIGALSSCVALAAVVTGNRSLRRDFQKMLAESAAQQQARLGVETVVVSTLDHLRSLLADIATQLSISVDARESAFLKQQSDLLDRILTLTHPGFIREFRRPPVQQPRRPEDLSPEEVAAAVQRMSLGVEGVRETVNGESRPARRINHPGYEDIERPPLDRRNLREPRVYGPRPRAPKSGEQEGAGPSAAAPDTASAAPPSGVPAESFNDSALSPEDAVAALTSS